MKTKKKQTTNKQTLLSTHEQTTRNPSVSSHHWKKTNNKTQQVHGIPEWASNTMFSAHLLLNTSTVTGLQIRQSVVCKWGQPRRPQQSGCRDIHHSEKSCKVVPPPSPPPPLLVKTLFKALLIMLLASVAYINLNMWYMNKDIFKSSITPSTLRLNFSLQFNTFWAEIHSVWVQAVHSYI